MTERITPSTVAFGAPFSLPGFDALLPPGTYVVSTEEQGTEVAGHLVYRRIATILRVEVGGRVEYHGVDPAALEAALHQDRETVARTALNDPQPPEPAVVQGKWPWRSIPKWVRIERPGRGS